MPSRALWIACLLAPLGAAAAMASCSTDGEVLTPLPQLDSALDFSVDSPSDAADARDARDTLDDGGRVRCGPDAACTLGPEQCCTTGVSLECVEAGSCRDGSLVECDRASQCAPGLRCCGQSAVFSITSSCRPSCAQYQLCAADDECPDGGHCLPESASTIGTCQP